MQFLHAVRCGLFAASVGLLLTAGSVARADDAAGRKGPAVITFITTLQKENIRKLKAAFEADNPDIRLSLSSFGAGAITDTLLAQQYVGDIDGIWGLSPASMWLLRDAGMLLPYAPAGLDEVPAAFRDQNDPPSWVGASAWSTALCVRAGVAPPARWSDLEDPRWRGRIAMPSPSASSSGMALVAGWIASMGEKAAWDFMDRLHENILFYTHEGSKPCRMASTGATDLGLSFDFRAAVTAEQTGQVVPLFLDGMGWDLSAIAILSSTENPEAAKRFADWAVSPRAREVYAQELGFTILGSGKVGLPGPHLPADLSERLAPVDFAWVAMNRGRILSIWQARYGDKVERLRP